MAWTDAQTAAIESRGKTVLVSAAAGSGKTTTLTERIIRSVTDPEREADISRILVVTFTKAAASDLKSKISKALTLSLAENPGNRHLCRQMIKLGGADICTIDAFYYKVVKENFDRLGIPAGLSIMDESESKVLLATLMQDVIEDFYESEPRGGDFWQFMDCFTDSRGNDTAASELLELYRKLGGYPENLEYLMKNAERLDAEAENSFFDSLCGKEISALCFRFFDHAEKVYSDALPLILSDEKAAKAYGPSFAYDIEHFGKMRRALEERNYGELKRLFDTYAPLRLGSLRNPDPEILRFRNLRKYCTERVKILGSRFFTADEGQNISDMRKTAAFCRMAYRLLCELDRRFSAEKRRRNVCDFTDNKRFALELFTFPDGTPTPYAAEYSERYDEIYIDEYQDTDLVQDRIFAAISRGNNRFMVGDIKQSIYRFRGANPDVFAQYKNSFPDIESAGDGDAGSIYMSENFRCDEPVISLTNRVCGFLFRSAADSIGYSPKDDLVFRKNVDTATRTMVPSRLCVVRSYSAAALKKLDEDKRKKYEGGKQELEAREVISEIRKLLQDESAVCEDKGVLRRIEPRDIAVLTRGNDTADRLARALSDAGIPSSARTDVRYFENPEVLLVLSLLNVIDNPQKDVYLAGVLRSPLFGFSMGELISVRALSDGGMSLFDDLIYASEHLEDEALRGKVSGFLTKLGEYREKARLLTVDKLIRYLYSDTMILSFAGLSSDGQGSSDAMSRRANLLMFYDYARKYESGTYKGLYSFIGYINDIIASEQKIETPAAEADKNVVQVMTIHNSKGLEFPVCFVVSLDKSFGASGARRILFDYKLGVGVLFGDESGFAGYTNAIYTAISERNTREDREEEMRVLYVAMTRARERLYLSASVGTDDWRQEAECEAPYADSETVLAQKSFFDWIMLAVLSGGEPLPFEMYEFQPYDLPQKESGGTAVLEPSASPDTEAEEERLLKHIKDFYGFEYPYSYLSKLPAKLSVSKLYPAVLDDAENDEAPSEIALYDLPRFLIPSEERASAADRGTATHTFMQFCDFKAAERDGVEKEIEKLCRVGLLPPESAKLIRTEWLDEFFKSDFYRGLSECRRVFREMRFHIKLPASKFTENDEFAEQLKGEEIVVQGVIDLVFEDDGGNIILCDYKTDALTSSELSDASLAQKKLAERHSLQLSYYKEAVRQIFGKEPARVCIYSLPLGEAVDIEV